MYTENDFFPLSAIQHYLFCPRQCGLMQLEGLWDDNALTAHGTMLHERVHSEGDETRKIKRFVRTLRIHSYELGVSGQTDLVEFYHSGKVVPVEYKRGEPKWNEMDAAQLCAQAMCLEEMLGISIPYGALFYWKPRSRERVDLGEELREVTRATAHAVHEMLASRETPSAKYSKKCNNCSLVSKCMPKALSEGKLARYMKELYRP